MIRKFPKYSRSEKMNLRDNQKKAINISYENDFESGVHFHATGTGKSLIAMNIITQYNNVHPTHNILWICESKSILIDQFSPISQKERNITDVMRRFNVLNFSNYKTSDWVDSINAAKFWNKNNLCFESFEYDAKTFRMLQRGDNIGITFAESPLMRLAFLKYKPNSLYDLAVCLSIIRPAAKDAKNVCEKNFKDFIIFDDDAIDFIAKECGISEADGDRLRRGFAKGDKKSIEEFRGIIAHFPVEKQKEMVRKLSNLSRYSFCKAHAFSYAQLIWKLAYMKCHRPFFISQSEIKNCSHYKFAKRIYMSPYDFWKATLNNCQSSYKKWVHMYEARIAGVDVYKKNLKKDDVSVYARNRRNKQEAIVANQWWSI